MVIYDEYVVCFSLLEHMCGKQMKLEKPYIEEFCNVYNIRLLSVDMTDANGVPELCYTFSDNSGFYTFKDVIESIKD